MNAFNQLGYPVIVGEWGMTNEDYDASPTALGGLFQQIVAWLPSAMFFFSHHEVDDMGTWGLVRSTDAPGAPGQPGTFVWLADADLKPGYNGLFTAA
jgi:hypothetical protein